MLNGKTQEFSWMRCSYIPQIHSHIQVTNIPTVLWDTRIKYMMYHRFFTLHTTAEQGKYKYHPTVLVFLVLLLLSRPAFKPCGSQISFCAELHVDGLVQDCSNSSANTLELLQPCTKPLLCWRSQYPGWCSALLVSPRTWITEKFST